MKVLFTAVLLTASVLGQRTLACSCAAPAPVADELKKSTAVFSGVVLESKVEGRNLAVKLSVDKNYKGLSWQKDMVVRTMASSAACGFGFAKGKEYLVYSYLTNEGQLATNLCWRTAALAAAAADVAELEKLAE